MLALQGCATKNYGRQGNLTDFEKQTMSCREIELEQAKVQGFIQHVDKESEFDGRSVLSFLGDFGIGNVIEKDSAMKSANDRAYQLQMKAYRGCSTAKPQPTAQLQPPSR
ncbi:hypothetical protein QO239_22895 [Cupriavidus taiwanensis]|uniref:hypothetical protein n=1 Tax=Cupriavidus taiwanensis TaxID=164546 RepID=UPI002540E806|nr:hypothetical protein [Cupriavidus taiwanensis]MDK3025450.1 hypothetical protein [Cupriavidus taiwanensis]